MFLNIIFVLLLGFIFIRTVSYGIYCIKETGVLSGISVFILAAGTIFTGWLVIFTDKGWG